MTNIKDGYLYTKDDEWIRVEDQFAYVGITDYAQDQLSDIVYLELPDVGDKVSAGEGFGVVESVKAAADLYAPVSGEVVEINEDLLDTPELINDDPYGDAWMVKIALKDTDELNELMDADAYRAYCDERG